MDVAALVLGIIGTVFAALSLGWNVAQYLLTGARPKLVPVIGMTGGRDGLMIDAVDDAWPTLLALESQLDTDPADRVVGVTVVNKGRAALHVANWGISVLPSGARHLPAPAHGSPAVPCTIPPGGQETLFTSAASVQIAAAATQAGAGRPQRVVATVTAGGRTRTSKPFQLPIPPTDGDA